MWRGKIDQQSVDRSGARADFRDYVLRFDGIPDDRSGFEGVIRARAGLIPFGAGRARLTSKDGAREADHFHDVDEIVTARRARARRSTTRSNRPHWKHLSSSRGGRPTTLDDQEIQKTLTTPQALLGPELVVCVTSRFKAPPLPATRAGKD
jgi:hypothetical protein